MTKKHTTMTQSEYAQARGLSRARVSQLAKAGKLAMTLDGRIDVAQTDALLALQTDNRGGHNKGGRDAAELKAAARERLTAKARKELAMAELSELQLARERRELMVATEVLAFVSSAATEFRVFCESLPAQLAPLLVGNDEERIQALMAEHMDNALTELSRKFARPGNLAGSSADPEAAQS
jgi:hypothetical protein